MTLLLGTLSLIRLFRDKIDVLFKLPAYTEKKIKFGTAIFKNYTLVFALNLFTPTITAT